MILDYSTYITEKASEGIVNYRSADSNLPIFDHKSICPFCGVEINETVFSNQRTYYPDWLHGSFHENESVVQCRICGWWEYKYSNSSDAILDGIRANEIEYSSAILKEYPDDSTDVCVEELRKYLLKDPSIIFRIDTHKMEDLVRSVFKDIYTDCHVETFGKTHDGGKDGLIVDADGRNIILQVKRRENANATEGITKIRELMGVACDTDNLRGCIFVSTADHFSKDAKDYAKRMIDKKRVECFDLIDCKNFIKKMELTREKLPEKWKELIKIKNEFLN